MGDAAVSRSKLGSVYPAAMIHRKDKEFHATIKQIRSQPGNRVCAECKASPTSWASVTLGVFVCMKCSQVHRNLGAHLSKVKSCMGTYLWHPDEIEQMTKLGNARMWRL
jgi:stromal membrane-associated protein